MFREDENNSIIDNSKEKLKGRNNERVIEEIKIDSKKKVRINCWERVEKDRQKKEKIGKVIRIFLKESEIICIYLKLKKEKKEVRKKTYKYKNVLNKAINMIKIIIAI